MILQVEGEHESIIMVENDVSMKIVDAAAIVHIWSEPSKLQTFNNT